MYRMDRKFLNKSKIPKLTVLQSEKKTQISQIN